MRKLAGLFCVLVISMALLVSCSKDECPVCPDPGESVSDYDVYLTGVGDGPIYVYNTREMEITDSFEVADASGISEISLSSDGRHLLVLGGISYGFRVYDLETMDTIPAASANGFWMEVSNDGKYIAVFGMNDVYFISGHDYTNVFQDEILTDGGSFSSDGTKFYCTADNNYVRIYDMASQSLDTVIQYMDNNGYSPAIYHVQPAQQAEKLFLTAGYPPNIYFLISYDLVSDSTTLSYSIGPPGGELDITPDGNQIIYSDPGQVIFDEFGSMHVIYIDPQTDAIISIIDAGRSVQGQPPTGFMPGSFAITPDSRYTIIASAGGAEAFGMIDNMQHRFVDVNVYEFETISFAMATCLKLPK